MISNKLVSHTKPLGPIIKEDISTFQGNACGSHLVFQNEAKNIPSQDFVMRNISCEFEISTFNTLCSRGPTKVLAESQKNTHGGHVVFQNEAKNIPSQDFVMRNISCEFDISTFNTLCSRGPTKVLAESRKNTHGGHVVFQNEAKNIPSQDFVMGNISCEFEISTFNTLCSRGPTKVLAESRKNTHGSHVVFQNEAKNIPGQDFMVMNISCKFEQ